MCLSAHAHPGTFTCLAGVYTTHGCEFPKMPQNAQKGPKKGLKSVYLGHLGRCSGHVCHQRAHHVELTHKP